MMFADCYSRKLYRLWAWLVIMALSPTAACQTTAETGPHVFFFDGASTWSLPFPSTPWSLADFPATDISLVESFVQKAQRAGAASPLTTVYFELETAPASDVDLASHVLIVDLESGDVATSKAGVVEAATKFFPANTLWIRPHSGKPLNAGSKYAAIVKTSLVDANGSRFRSSPGLDTALTKGTPFEPADLERVYQHVARTDIAGLTIFDVAAPQAQLADGLKKLLSGTQAQLAKPHIVENSLSRDDANVIETLRINGRFTTIDLQNGNSPFLNDGGDIKFVDGEPQIVRNIELRFALHLPKNPTDNSVPLVVYQHGTGGDWNACSGWAVGLAAEGIATFCNDQIFHGERAGATSGEIASYNILNPTAFEDVPRQSAIDLVQIGRLCNELKIPISISGLSSEVSFDCTLLSVLGHSQGAINGALALGVSDLFAGAVFTGPSGEFQRALYQKQLPISIPDLVEALLDIEKNSEMLEIYHPALTLFQTAVDRAEPIHYLRNLANWSNLAQRRAPHVLTVVGRHDLHAPPEGAHALAKAAGLALISDQATEGDVVLTPVATVSSNSDSGSTVATSEWNGDHFVAANDVHARAQVLIFLREIAQGNIPRLSSQQ